MKRALPLVGALLIALWVPLGGALAAPKFPALTGRVVDDARVLSPQAEQDLNGRLEALESKTGRQLVVATLPSLQGYEIEDYGYQLGRAWGIGQKGQNDGVLFIVAPNERKTRIEVGYGLEPILTDALSSLILQQRVLPRFRAGDIQGGVVDGAQAIIDQLALPEDQAKAKVAQAQKAPSRSGSPWGAIVGMVVIFWLLSSVVGALGGRNRRRGHGSSFWWLLPLILSSSGRGGGSSWGGGGGGGFSGGGGSFGGGGSSGSW